MPSFDNRIIDVLEDLEAFLVARRDAHAQVGLHDAALDRVGEGEALGRLDVFVFLKQLGRQQLAHERLVALVEGRELSEIDVLEVIRVLGIRRRGRALLLGPSLELGHVRLLVGRHGLRSFCRSACLLRLERVEVLLQRAAEADAANHAQSHAQADLHGNSLGCLLVGSSSGTGGRRKPRALAIKNTSGGQGSILCGHRCRWQVPYADAYSLTRHVSGHPHSQILTLCLAVLLATLSTEIARAPVQNVVSTYNHTVPRSLRKVERCQGRIRQEKATGRIITGQQP